MGFRLPELGLDLGVGAATLDRLHYLALEVDAALNHVEHLVAGAKHAGEQPEFLVKELIPAAFGQIAPVGRRRGGRANRRRRGGRTARRTRPAPGMEIAAPAALGAARGSADPVRHAPLRKLNPISISV